MQIMIGSVFRKFTGTPTNTSTKTKVALLVPEGTDCSTL